MVPVRKKTLWEEWRGTILFLLIVGAILGYGYWNNHHDRSPHRPTPYQQTPLWADQGSTGYGTRTTHGGYENPAPGDDGTADCPPGGGPVYVGLNDPNGLDGDGDGWGCE